MLLAVDVMGFENDINEAIKACRKFRAKHIDTNFVLVGDKQKIMPNLRLTDKFYLEVLNASEYVKMDDEPLKVIRNKNTSMYKMFEALANNSVDGVLSAGNTSCFISLAYLLIRPIAGVNKPGFMPCLPTIIKNKPLFMIDVGANKECSGVDLYQFAKMADIYCKKICGITSPKIGVANIGTEEHKGFTYHYDANKLLLNDKTINYVGFIEPRNVLNGEIDVLVSDGYTGNLLLKAYEGTLKTIGGILKKSYKKIFNWLGALFSINVIKKVTKTFDYKRNAGALVIGLNKVVVKTHGSADCKQFYSSLEMLYKSVKNEVISALKEEFTK